VQGAGFVKVKFLHPKTLMPAGAIRAAGELGDAGRAYASPHTQHHVRARRVPRCLLQRLCRPGHAAQVQVPGGGGVERKEGGRVGGLNPFATRKARTLIPIFFISLFYVFCGFNICVNYVLSYVPLCHHGCPPAYIFY
jgi:hypothetical protein